MAETAEKTQSQEVAQFTRLRLPFHPKIEERFGVDSSGWNALVTSVYPSAKSVDSVIMVLAYCKARHLDPFKRPVHIVPMWDSQRSGYVDTVWPGIAEIRTTAARTNQYAGCDETKFGPEVTRTFKGTKKLKGGKTEDVEMEVVFPEWAEMTVYRIVSGQRCAFVGPKVYWMETYATVGKTDLPNDMWARRTRGQLDKCAEAAALRKAFPEEVGGELTAEEMFGQRIDAEMPMQTIETLDDKPEKKQAPRVVQAGAGKPLPPRVGENPPSAEQEAPTKGGEPPTKGAEAPSSKKQEPAEEIEDAETVMDWDAWMEETDTQMRAATQGKNGKDDVDEVWATRVEVELDLMPKEYAARLNKLYEDCVKQAEARTETRKPEKEAPEPTSEAKEAPSPKEEASPDIETDDEALALLGAVQKAFAKADKEDALEEVRQRYQAHFQHTSENVWNLFEKAYKDALERVRKGGVK